MVENVSEEGALFVAASEGFREKPYLDDGGVPTIGHGLTFYPNATKVTLWDKAITKDYSLSIVRFYLGCIWNSLSYLYPAAVRAMTQPQVDALASFCYNLFFAYEGVTGTHAHACAGLKQTTLGKLLEMSNLADIPTQIKRWCHLPDGQQSMGLLNRRNREIKLFVEGKYE